MNEKMLEGQENINSKEQDIRDYNDPREFLSDFEDKINFEEEVNKRVKIANDKNPDELMTEEEISELRDILRDDDIYKQELFKYHDSHRLKLDPDLIPDEARNAIYKYWDIIQEMRDVRFHDKKSVSEHEDARIIAHSKAANKLFESGFAPSFRTARVLISFMTSGAGLGHSNPNRDAERAYNLSLPRDPDD